MDRLMNRMTIVSILVVFLGLIMGNKVTFGAETPEEFFRGKTLLLITAPAGTPMDLISRIIAPTLAKEIGAKIKVENSGPDETANFTYRGTRDGLTLGLTSSADLTGNEILNAPGVQYKTDKFNFIADVYPSIKVLQLSPKLAYKTVDALRKAKGLRGGGTVAKGSIAVSTAVMFEILGLDGKVITGFKGKKELTLAMTRGEVDLMATGDSTAARDEKDGLVFNLTTTSDKRSLTVPHVPSLSDLGVKVPKELVPAQKFISSNGSVVALPPGVPQERVEYLRRVFKSLGNNQDVQKAMEKLTGVWTPFVPGEELQRDMTEIIGDKELASRLDAIFKKYTAVR